MITSKQVIESTRAYIAENFLYARPDFVIGEGDSLLGRGIIDSLGVMEIVEFLGAQFGIVAQDEDMTEQNFGTLAGIARFVLLRSAAETAEPVNAEA